MLDRVGVGGGLYSSAGIMERNAETEDTIMVKDPVCGMTIDEKTAAGKSEYQGQTIYFCAAICKTKFDQNPERYIGK